MVAARYFPPVAKQRIQALADDLKAAFKARIERLDWMSPTTKARALEKLSKTAVYVGYPDRPRDYRSLVIRRDDLYGDVRRAAAFEWRFGVGLLDKPVDRGEWTLTPQTFNAYSDPILNEVVFPAGILQPPLFDPEADPAVNYGAIGAVIGHELTHGFDDEGRKYDGDGRLADWWTAEDAAAFEARAARLSKQYSSYVAPPGVRLNGQLTLGENIADLGGVLLALDAYHVSLKGAPAPVVDGLTGDQRFFLGYAQAWRGKQREASLRRRIVSDPHSPRQFRVNGVVPNVDAWYDSFDVKSGRSLFLDPGERVRIW